MIIINVLINLFWALNIVRLACALLVFEFLLGTSKALFCLMLVFVKFPLPLCVSLRKVQYVVAECL
jgi:hypothetical protein